MPPTPHPLSSQKSERAIDVRLPFRIPARVDRFAEGHEKWMRMVHDAEVLIKDDVDLQRKAAKGLRLKERRLPPEVIGRLYTQYCALINRMYERYLNNVQLQKVEYIQEIIAVLMKRMFEIRNELTHIIVNDYIFVDSALQQLLKTPIDIQIAVPYHYPLEARPDSVEQLLQKMWIDAVRRKNRVPREPKKKKAKPVSTARLAESGLMFEDADDFPLDEPTIEEESKEESEEEEEWPKKESEHSMISEDYLQALLIQRHERFRQFFIVNFIQKCNHRRTYFAKHVTPAPIELQTRAATLIQKFYRRVMELKRQRLREHKRDILLGIVPDVDVRPLQLIEETNKFYEIRRQTRMKINKKYQEDIEKVKTKVLILNKGDQIEDITQDILEWFFEWYYGYGFFPQYPYDVEGGTLLVIQGQYSTIEEKQEADEKYKAATKGKTKDQLKEEKEQAKLDAELKAEIEEDKRKKAKLALFKSRCNPIADLGYEAKQSEYSTALVDALRRYRQAWSIYDDLPKDSCAEVIYGYMKPVIVEDVMHDLHIECRKYVDELMRLELKLFVKAQQAMFKRVAWPWPKQRPRPRPKPIPVPKPFNVDDEMLKSVERVFDLGIMSKPTTKLDDVIGDLSYGAYEYNLIDPIAKFPSPGYGDVKRRIMLSCILGSGIEPGAVRNKCVLLLGLPDNGKSFLVDAVAGEMGAVKFDISPKVFSAVVNKPGKVLSLVFTAARIFQPSVIFLRDIEKVFYKTVPSNERREKAKVLKKPLTKLLKTIPSSDKIIFIATCSNPWVAKVRPMMKLFSEIILVPQPDYGSIQRFLYDSFQKIRSMPRDYCVQGLAKILQGLGFGAIMEMYDNVMTSERICKLNITPFQPSEFLEYLIANDIEPATAAEYQKLIDLQLQYSPLKAEREEYEIINKARERAYETINKKKREAAEKKAKQLKK